MPAPFLARIPKKYLVDAEERKFWEYLITYLDGSSDVDPNSQPNAVTSSDRLSIEQAEARAAILASLPSNANETTTRDFTAETEALRAETLARQRDIVVTGGTHLATAGDYITATNNAIILLPVAPSNFEFVGVTNGDGSTIKIRSSTKKIIDVNEITTTIKDSYYGLQYTVYQDYWGVR